MTDSAIYPVILAVPADKRELRGRDQVNFLSGYAREALALSAARSAVEWGTPVKDADGVPQPVDGVYWSLTHKPDYVGGVVARAPVGIDLEGIRPCSAKLIKRVGSDREWDLGDGDQETLFTRFWTSKETVLKASGVGFKGFSKCRVVSVPNDLHLVIDFQKHRWPIEHYYFDGYIASVLMVQEDIRWTILTADKQPWVPESAENRLTDGK